ncbi:MAG: DUF2232 domain-containing protein [Gemmatimonadales bacterium]
MNDVVVPPAPGVSPATRERGWWRVVLGLLAFLFLPMTPMLRILLPVDQTLVLLAPALAACALVGWWAGGRLPLALMWTALAGWVLWQSTAGEGTVAQLLSGWAVLLAAAFGAIGLSEQRDAQRPLLPRALTAMALAGLIGGATALAVPNGGAAMRQSVQAEVDRRGSEVVAEWQKEFNAPKWREMVATKPFVDTLATQMEQQLQAAPRYAVTLFPAMLALESLTALALAWAVYHRVGRARIGPPLAALRDFRFSDHAVWGLIAGLGMLVSGLAPLGTVGANLLLFFGVLYALRGLGVVLWFLAPGRLVAALMFVFAVLFWQVLGVVALGVGVGDTWLDWRRRARPKA